jgi:hypothetical protein
MRKWLVATLVAFTMAAGLVAYQPAPHRAEAGVNYCTAQPQTPYIGRDGGTVWGFVYWSCSRKPAGQQAWVQLQRLWTSDGRWHNQGAARTFTVPSSSETYSDSTACHHQTTTRRWRTHTWGLVWFVANGPVSSWNYFSNSSYLHCWS